MTKKSKVLLTSLPTKALKRLALELSESISIRNGEVRDAVRKAPRGGKKGLTIPQARDAVIAAAVEIRKLRTEKERKRRKFDYMRNSFGRPIAKEKGPFKQETSASLRRALRGVPLQERLDERRRELVSRYACYCFRHGASGGHTMRVRITDDPGEVNYSVRMDKNFGTYRGRFKGWAASEDHHLITVPRLWLSRVYKRGIAVVDGLLTLDAAPCDSGVDDVQLYKAVFAEQSRGYSVKVTRGYIARGGGYSYHASTIRGALTGLTQKRRGPISYAAAHQERIDSFCSRYKKIDGVVRVSDARAVGACDYGIRSWCYSNGLPYEDGQAPLGIVIDAYRASPVPEARAAIIHAAKRIKQESEHDIEIQN